MASIHKELTVEVGADKAWAALRLVGEADKVFAPVLVEAQLDGDIRTVRFANEMVLRELIVTVDDAKRRVAYSAIAGPGMTYHHSSMQIVDQGPEQCLFVWISDFLPAEVGPNIAPLIEQGANALKANLEAR